MATASRFRVTICNRLVNTLNIRPGPLSDDLSHPALIVPNSHSNNMKSEIAVAKGIKVWRDGPNTGDGLCWRRPLRRMAAEWHGRAGPKRRGFRQNRGVPDRPQCTKT